MYSSVPFSLRHSSSFLTNFSPLPKKYYVLSLQVKPKLPEPIKIEEPFIPVIEEVIIDEPKSETKPKRKGKK
jgi:hypothetical protein